MVAVNEVLESAKRECKARGVPITSKRVNVYSLLLLSKKALSAYQIVNRYQKMFDTPVPVITVYRVLEFLQSKNLVHKLETENKFVVCAYAECKYTHPASQFLICKECLKVKELTMTNAYIEELKQLVEKAGFRLNSPQLEMNCICDDCYTNDI